MKEASHAVFARTTALFLGMFILAAAHANAGEAPTLTGPYLGQEPPGLEAEVFAPDLVSQLGRYEYAVSFAPGGEWLLFTVQTAENTVQVLQSRVIDGVWTDPNRSTSRPGARKTRWRRSSPATANTSISPPTTKASTSGSGRRRSSVTSGSIRPR